MKRPRRRTTVLPLTVFVCVYLLNLEHGLVVPLWRDAALVQRSATAVRFQTEEEPLSFNPSLVRPPTTNHTMSACLLVSDDSIKLSEWMAYHYTVLPLGHLVVAVDPHTVYPERIQAVLEPYQRYLGMNITLWQNDTWHNIPPDQGWQNGRISQPGRKDYAYKVHLRRQNLFAAHCLQELHRRGVQDWVLLTDSDEYLLYNARHPATEDPTLYDAQHRGRSVAQIDAARQRNLPLRDQLPILGQESLASFLDRHRDHFDRPCLRVPGLALSMFDSHNTTNRNVPTGLNPQHFVTMRHRIAGNRTGTFSKALVDLSRVAHVDDLDWTYVQTIHNPNWKLCGDNGASTSGTDYISSVLRLNHYVGTYEAYTERKADGRGDHRSVEDWHAKNGRESKLRAANESIIPDEGDLRPWLATFVNHVGSVANARYLTWRLAEAYDEA